MKRRYVSVAGIMGVGKTTLVKFIADEFQLHPVLENFKHNPFLADFYQDMKRWGFHSQTFFLLEKAGQLHQVKNILRKSTIVQDTPIYEDVYGYARTLQKRKQISIHEWRMYHRLFKQLEKNMVRPDLIIYLGSSVETVYKRIQSRDRLFETQTKKQDLLEYLSILHKNNSEWVHRMNKKIPVAQIDIDDFDYLHRVDKKIAMRKLIAELFTTYKIQ